MSLAAAAREAVRAEPFLHRALRAGVVNYRAAADYLALDGDPDAVATALRRYADELDPPATDAVDVPVRMQRGVGLADSEEVDDEDVVVAVGDQRLVRNGDMTAVRAAGGVDARALGHTLARLDAASVLVDAAGVAGGELVVVVPNRQGASALRVVEDALGSVPA
jgi:hypothetical protein